MRESRRMHSSFVSKARVAFHNAASRAERVLTEIKADLKAEFGKPSNLIDQGSEDKGDLSCIGKIELERSLENEVHRHTLEVSKSLEKVPADECTYGNVADVVTLPSSMFLRRLAAAIEVGRNFKIMKDIEMFGKDASQGGDWPGLTSGLAAMRKLSLRDKGDKLYSSAENHNYILSLFNIDSQYKAANTSMGNLQQATSSKFPEEIHGAPLGSFVAYLAEIMAGLRTEQMMAEFWSEVVSELRRHWAEEQPIPRLPLDATPDLCYCLLHQQLQVINCCISRKKRHASALASLDALSKLEGFAMHSGVSDSRGNFTLPSFMSELENNENVQPSILYAKRKDGKLTLRLGANCQAGNLKMLETGEPIYSPVTQEGPVLTEDLIKETEELILRTGSVGAGCSQLFSDMQAFMAANPGCILEDFVRWYSPLDWRQDQDSEPYLGNLQSDCVDGDEVGARGYLSARMQCQGNLWQELWASAKPVPAAKQVPLYDEDLAGGSILDELEEMCPAQLFEGLFTTFLGIGFAIAESAPAATMPVIAEHLKVYKDYIISACGKGMDSEKLENLCEVYEGVETILQSLLDEPQKAGAIFAANYATEAGTASGGKSGKHHSHASGIEQNLFKHPVHENNQQEKSESASGILSRILEVKLSLFEKKNIKE
eukprot:c26847_g1_i1 orf=350-2323(-)